MESRRIQLEPTVPITHTKNQNVVSIPMGSSFPQAEQRSENYNLPTSTTPKALENIRPEKLAPLPDVKTEPTYPLLVENNARVAVEEPPQKPTIVPLIEAPVVEKTLSPEELEEKRKQERIIAEIEERRRLQKVQFEQAKKVQTLVLIYSLINRTYRRIQKVTLT
jgi:hypothetical protein